MNPVHPMTYHVVKAEQEQQLARLERQRQAMAGHSATEAPSTEPVRARFIPRRVAIATASAALLLSLVAGAAFALQTPAADTTGAGQNIPGGAGGGGGNYLLR